MKQYMMLDWNGNACGCIWADRVQPDGSGSWIFYVGERMVATAWDGYEDAGKKFIRPKAEPVLHSRERKEDQPTKDN